MTAREKILATIRGIMAKTIENGCTESEAMAALDKARAMMDAYEVTDEDLLLKGEKAAIFNSTVRDPHGIRNRLGTKVAEFTDCKIWRQANGCVSMCGLESDVEFGNWLLETLSNFVKLEMVKYLSTIAYSPKEKKYHVNGFVGGATGKIVERLAILILASKSKESGNGRALVVAKSALIDETMKAEGLKFGTGRARRRRVSTGSFAAGTAAGDRASFHRPVAGGGPLQLT